MFDLNTLKFDEKGLIPAVVVDALSKKVLTVAYMNRESLEISMKEGKTCFWSRSRQELWRKGETSGNFQHIVSITADCDRDALTVEVLKDGPACHLGTEASVYKGYKRDKIEMRGDRAEMSDFPLYLNTVAGGLDCRNQAIGGFSFVVKIYALPVVEIIGQFLYLLGRYGFDAQIGYCF